MKKNLVAIAILVTITPFLSPSCFASSGPISAGKPCKAIGIMAKIGGQNLFCTKSGKYLKWSLANKKGSTLSNFGVHKIYEDQSCTSFEENLSYMGNGINGTTKLTCKNVQGSFIWTSQPIPLSTPSRVPSETPVPASTAASTPSSTVDSLSFLAGHESEIPSIAFALIQKNKNQKAISALSVNLLLGPNSKSNNQNEISSLLEAQAVWSNFEQPSILNAVTFGWADVNWAQRILFSLLPGIYSTLASDMCRSVVQCGDARSLGTVNNQGLIAIALPTGPGADEYHTSGGIEIHEYTHIVQNYLDPGQVLAPTWWEEGHAMFTGISASSKDLVDYKRQKKWLVSSFVLNGGVETTETSISNHLLENQAWTAPVGNPPGAQEAGFGYGIGSLFVEALTAVKGVDPSMQVWKYMGSGMSFLDAFKSSYGFTYAEAVATIAPIIAKELKDMNN